MSADAFTNWTKRHPVVTVVIAIVIAGVIAFAVQQGKQAEHEAAVDECQRKGIDYVSSIGSLPRLTDGRRAVDVARERCERRVDAFDSILP